MVDFQALFRHSPNPYMVVGPDLRYLAANEAYAAAVSASVDALVGRFLFEVFPGDAGADGPSQSTVVSTGASGRTKKAISARASI